MIRLEANLKWLFSELPFWDRFAAAARCGFRGVEYSLPYAYDARDIRRRCDDLGLAYCYLITPVPDWDLGGRGLACIPGREQEFRDGVQLAIEYAGVLDCPLIHAGAGIQPDGADDSHCRDVLLENVDYACTQAGRAGLRVAIEPICHQSYPRYFIKRTADVATVIATLGHANLGIVYDVHHASNEEGALAETIGTHINQIHHFQIANPPGRNEPGVGEVNFPYLLAHAERLGYGGWWGLEYRPAKDTWSSFAWAKPYGIG